MYKGNFYLKKMLEIFFKNRGKIWPKYIFFVRFQLKLFGYESDDFKKKKYVTFEKKKNFRLKNVRKSFENNCCPIFFYNIFLWTGSFAPPYLPPGLRPWIPHDFGLRTLVGTGSCSTAYQQKISTFFFLKSKNFFFL